MTFIDDSDPIDQNSAGRLAEDAASRQRRRELAAGNIRFTALMYKQLFSAEASRAVLEDLREFCRGDASTYDDNERIHCLLTGRQEVWLRIMDFLKNPVEDSVNKRVL